jgi:4-hydroxy 2-oxovalerate aldolase/long-chain acyl-CoA synthetase
MVNYMKTYIVPPEEFAKNAAWAEKQGAECVYIVDSAGCMIPADLKAYYEATRKISKVKLGFHGHNNLGMAVSNSVYCAELGFEMLDTSMQGLGRSLGNASTEMTIMTLKKMGHEIDTDIPRLLEYGYVSLRDITEGKVQNPLDLVCGYAGFHSSYIKYVYKCCSEKQVDPLRLILAYSAVNQRDLDYQELCDVADTLPKDLEDNPYTFREYFSKKYEC